MARYSLHVSLTVLISIITLAHARTWAEDRDAYTWEDYKVEFNREYTDRSDEETRRQIFDANLASIRAHNAGTKTWKRGVNHLTDATDEELAKLRGYSKTAARAARAREGFPPGYGRVPTDTSAKPSAVHHGGGKAGGDIDYMHLMTPMKDQGMCGSCWSMGAAEAAEAQWALKTGKLDTLSPQQFLDCTPNPHHCGQGDGPGGNWGSGGCDGGTPELAYAAAAKAGGLQTGWDYPYESYMGKDFDCRLGTVKLHRGKQANVTGVFKTITNNYTDVYNALKTRGPLAISTDTTGWDSYESGVFDGCNQTHPDLDHVVLLAGAGTDPTTGLAYCTFLKPLTLVGQL